MAKASGPSITAPSAARQVRFHQLLIGARKTWLMDALSDALATVDPERLKREILQFVPKDAQQLLAGSGIRDEHVFPLPALLEAKPTLVGVHIAAEVNRALVNLTEGVMNINRDAIIQLGFDPDSLKPLDGK